TGAMGTSPGERAQGDGSVREEDASPPRGLAIALLGPDGSGKSSVVEGLVRELAPHFTGWGRMHFRPNFGRKDNTDPVPEPHAKAPRGRVASVAKLGYYLADYWLGYAFHVVPAVARGQLLVFDRYYHDLLVDPARYRLANVE